MDAKYISLIVNCGVLFIVIAMSVFLVKKIRMENSSYKLFFCFYVLFWIPLMLLRYYTGIMHSKSLMASKALLWIPLTVYGFVGIFYRTFNDYLAYIFRQRRLVILVTLLIELITFIPIVIYPCFVTNVIQSVGIGIGASCIGVHQLFFNEQYSQKKTFLTVSILSIPPLIADFIASPVQSIVATLASDNGGTTYSPEILKYMWLIGLAIVCINFALLGFVKEDPELFGKDVQYKTKIEGKSDWMIYILIVLIGSILCFVKFANSGSISYLQLTFLADQKNVNSVSFQGYLSLIFSFSQLIGGLLTGLFFVPRIGKQWTFLVGCCLWIVYQIVSTIVFDPYIFLGVHWLNGFSYGIVYNLVLASVLQKTFKKCKIVTPMGLYQSILAVGITSSLWFTGWIKGPALYNAKDGKIQSLEIYKHANFLVDIVDISLILIMLALFFFVYYYQKHREQNQQKFLNAVSAATNV